ncbi:MAG: aminopeptidase P N-terminal domain-containing protein [Bacteroidia bacterium]|nr:aminopeptidase P N-terminal domain-containing protein [Bacteroidia bacterium]
MRYQPLPPDLYRRNRAKLNPLLPPGHALVLFSNAAYTDNADSTYRFSQNSNLLYLTGIDQEECILLLFPDCPKPELREVLFIRRTSPYLQLWEGWKYSPEEATAQSGIETIRFFDDFEGVVRQLVQLAEGFVLEFNEHERNAVFTPTPAHTFARRLREEFPAHGIRRAWPILAQLRMQKEPEEVAQLRRAIAITGETFAHLLQWVRPGVREYEVEAEILHGFVRRGATKEAFGSIVASGPNAVVLHYVLNHSALEAGHALLIDFGAEYGNYSADLTRVIPVGATFSPRQRAVYQAVYNVKAYAQSLLKPGVLLEEYTKSVGLYMQDQLLELGLLTQAEVNEAPQHQPAYKKYFPHGVSHHLGLDTHDVHLRHLPLAPGMVITVEPGIYIPEEGLGIRLEDDVLITETGMENLAADVPLALDAIEAARGQA